MAFSKTTTLITKNDNSKICVKGGTFRMVVNLPTNFVNETSTEKLKILKAKFQQLQGFCDTEAGRVLVDNKATNKCIRQFYVTCFDGSNTMVQDTDSVRLHRLLVPPGSLSPVVPDMPGLLIIDKEDSPNDSDKSDDLVAITPQGIYNMNSTAAHLSHIYNHKVRAEASTKERMSEDTIDLSRGNDGVSIKSNTPDSIVITNSSLPGSRSVGVVKDEICKTLVGWPYLKSRFCTDKFADSMDLKIKDYQNAVDHLDNTCKERDEALSLIEVASELYTVHFQKLMRSFELLSAGASSSEHCEFLMEIDEFQQKCREGRDVLPLDNVSEISCGVDLGACEQYSVIGLMIRAKDASLKDSCYSKIVRLMKSQSSSKPSYMSYVMGMVSRLSGDKEVRLEIDNDHARFKSHRSGKRSMSVIRGLLNRNRILNKNRIDPKGVDEILMKFKNGLIFFRNY